MKVEGGNLVLKPLAALCLPCCTEKVLKRTDFLKKTVVRFHRWWCNLCEDSRAQLAPTERGLGLGGLTPNPATDQFTDLVNFIGDVGVLFCGEQLEIMTEPNQIPKFFQLHICLSEQR